MNKYEMFNKIWWLSLVLLIGLSIGALWQASNDIITMNKMLNESAINGTVLSDGTNYYTVNNYVFPARLNYTDYNLTYVYDNKTYDINGVVK